MPLETQSQQAVLAEQNGDSGVAAAHIGVTANADVVTLTAQVDWNCQKKPADQDVHYVVSYSDQVVVNPTPFVIGISTKGRNALLRSWWLEQQNVAIRADGGSITTHSPHDRHLAEATPWIAPDAASAENDIAIFRQTGEQSR